jgi:hypothetical protein
MRGAPAASGFLAVAAQGVGGAAGGGARMHTAAVHSFNHAVPRSVPFPLLAINQAAARSNEAGMSQAGVKRASADDEPTTEPTSKRSKMQSEPDFIDENLHSRQLAVYGREAFRKFQTATVLVAGMNGLGVEIGTSGGDHGRGGCVWVPLARALITSIARATPLAAGPAAKNVILAGVRAVTIHDIKAVDTRDLGAQFYLTPEDVGQNRAEACRDKLQELNTAVEVTATAQDLTADFIRQFQVGGVARLEPALGRAAQSGGGASAGRGLGVTPVRGTPVLPQLPQPPHRARLKRPHFHAPGGCPNQCDAGGVEACR